MKKSFKDRLSALGLSYTKEMLILLAVNAVIIGIMLTMYLLLKEISSFVIGGLLLAIANFFYLSRYSTLEKDKEMEHVEELVSLLSYFEIFISNGNNVYNSFKLLLPYCSSFMDDAVNTLLNQIDDDKSVGPFIRFASKFNNRIIESLMLSIYQMVDNGEQGEQFKEFDVLFTSINREYKDNLIEKTKTSLNSLNSWPLFGAGGITVVLALSTIGIIGDYINVI